VPIWVTAAQQGKISSTLFWPGSEALNQGLQPNDWLPYDGKMTSMQRAEKLLAWLNRSDEKRADFATLYFSEVDSAGHEYGPKSPEVNTAIQNVDQAIKAFAIGLEQLGLLANTSFVITSDHGMAEVNEKNIIDIKAPLKDYPQVIYKWFGPLAGLDVNAEQSLEVLAILKQQAHMQCWPKQNLPKQYHYGTHRRIPQIVCLAELGWTITDNPAKKPIPGQHGYDPSLSDMHGIFIASGYRIKQQKLDTVNNIDVYPLLMKLLSLDGGYRDADDHLIKLIEK
jgi:predicted AlkP superfamily pyrophosphatase or phosphodiesterase